MLYFTDLHCTVFCTALYCTVFGQVVLCVPAELVYSLSGGPEGHYAFNSLVANAFVLVASSKQAIQACMRKVCVCVRVGAPSKQAKAACGRCVCMCVRVGAPSKHAKSSMHAEGVCVCAWGRPASRPQAACGRCVCVCVCVWGRPASRPSIQAFKHFSHHLTPSHTIPSHSITPCPVHNQELELFLARHRQCVKQPRVAFVGDDHGLGLGLASGADMDVVLLADPPCCALWGALPDHAKVRTGRAWP